MRNLSFLQTQEKEKEKEKHKKKRKKEKIYHLRTQIFAWLLQKFKVNSLIIMYRNYKYYY